MNKKDLILNILLFISQIIVFYYFFCYLLPFKEQLQMFQFTSQYLTETLKQAGGVAIYISEFLSQFFWGRFDDLAATVFGGRTPDGPE